MISKKLLSGVLNYDVIELSGPDMFFNTISYSDGYEERKINTYELMHKCKEWAYEKYDISILSLRKSASINSDKHLAPFTADTEPEAIFKACEWILKNE